MFRARFRRRERLAPSVSEKSTGAGSAPRLAVASASERGAPASRSPACAHDAAVYQPHHGRLAYKESGGGRLLRAGADGRERRARANHVALLRSEEHTSEL